MCGIGFYQFLLQQVTQQITAIGEFTAVGISAMQVNVADLIVINTQQAYQGNLFFFAFGRCLLQ